VRDGDCPCVAVLRVACAFRKRLTPPPCWLRGTRSRNHGGKRVPLRRRDEVSATAGRWRGGGQGGAHNARWAVSPCLLTCIFVVAQLSDRGGRGTFGGDGSSAKGNSSSRACPCVLTSSCEFSRKARIRCEKAPALRRHGSGKRLSCFTLGDTCNSCRCWG
jgi:hypothetical protein